MSLATHLYEVQDGKVYGGCSGLGVAVHSGVALSSSLSSKVT